MNTTPFTSPTVAFKILDMTIETGLISNMVDARSDPNLVYGQPFNSEKSHDKL